MIHIHNILLWHFHCAFRRRENKYKRPERKGREKKERKKNQFCFMVGGRMGGDGWLLNRKDGGCRSAYDQVKDNVEYAKIQLMFY